MTLRNEFARTMERLAKVDKDLVVLVGDISHGIFRDFAQENPMRYFNVGICEPTIVSMSAGLSRIGMVPVAHTIAPFITERSFEQIKLDLGYQNLSANIVSVGASFDYAQLGCSHHCYTDVALLSHLKRASVFLPSNLREFDVLFSKSYRNGGINYFRLTENAHGIHIPELEPGRICKVRDGEDLTIVALGPQLKSAVAVADFLLGEAISCDVLYVHTFKPLEVSEIEKSVKKTRRLVTLEELSMNGGLYSVVTSALAGRFLFGSLQFAVGDFVHGYGTYSQLCERAGLGTSEVVSRIRKLLI